MPRIEVLPSSSSYATPGWAYVPDTAFDRSKAAIKPTAGRKRGIREPGNRTDVTSRQNNAIIRHLAELDRENHKDVHIPLPVKQKEAASRVPRGKTTSNVRRILQSQKTFRNYLDDEEAALAQAQHATTTTQRPTTKTTKLLRRSSTPATPRSEQTRPRKSTLGPTTTTGSESSATTPPSVVRQRSSQLIKSEFDKNPLLCSYPPPAPSERTMQALLSEPPLTYNASRAGPSSSGKPPRLFCVICGYWGKIRCRNCHVRTCGLECYKIHEDSRCGAFF